MALVKYICLYPVLPKYWGLDADYESQEAAAGFQSHPHCDFQGALVPPLTVAMVS